jgi:5-methylcytosine-specific restriction endonuclease McrA
MIDSSTARTMKGGRADVNGVPNGQNGRALCRWCGLETPRNRRTFCSEYCVNEWRLRTDPSYLREKTFERDRGRCAVCSVDTSEAWRELKKSRGATRARLLLHWGLRSVNRRSLWDADHIVPVVEGGGECDLDNIRTLCLICHRRATGELRERRAARAKPTVGEQNLHGI